jgi:hypothetical protein
METGCINHSARKLPIDLATAVMAADTPAHL